MLWYDFYWRIFWMNDKKKTAATSDNGKLIAYLEAMIASGRFAAGDQLPPLRKLAEQFSLTPSCAHRAIRTLCERGLLELHQGSGTFVRGTVRAQGIGNGVISVAIWDSTLIQSYCAYALQGLQEAAAAASWQLKFFFASYEQMAANEQLPRDLWKCDAAAFLGCYDMFEPVFRNIPRPCVELPKAVPQKRIRGDRMPWNLDNDRPIYLQLMERIQHDIISGVYQPGDKLPSVRDLAVEAAVNPNTMQKALSELERCGLVYSQRTSGRFITDNTAMIKEMRTELAQEHILDFFGQMRQLGFSDEDTLNLIRDAIKKGVYNESDS